MYNGHDWLTQNRWRFLAGNNQELRINNVIINSLFFKSCDQFLAGFTNIKKSIARVYGDFEELVVISDQQFDLSDSLSDWDVVCYD